MFYRISKWYFSGDVSPDFRKLFTGRTLTLVGSTLIGLFLPIFYYELFGASIIQVLWFYALIDLGYMVTVPLGAQFASAVGFSRSLFISILMAAGFYTTLYFLGDTQSDTLVTLALILAILVKLFFWLPYHVGFARFSDPSKRSREISSVMALNMFLSVIGPITAAGIIIVGGYNALFLVGVAIYLLALIPFWKLPLSNECYEWSYPETFWRFFRQLRYSRALWAYMAFGAENVVGLIIWPIFIFTLLQGNYLEVGALSAVIVLVTMVLQLLVGKRLDLKREAQSSVFHWGTMFYSVGWIAKMFIVTAGEIFFAGVYHGVAKVFSHTSFNSLNVEITADNGHFIDEYTVLKEIAVTCGRFLMTLFALVLATALPIVWIFLAAALLSLALTLLQSRDLSVA